MTSASIYCTYITIYRGEKFPTFYIGSSSIKKIDAGYRGSVASKRYKDLWYNEIAENPHLFKTTIISTHETSKEARERELYLHKKLGVVKNSLYVNLSEAKINGYFGRDVSGENNPMFGWKWGGDHPHPRGMLGKKMPEDAIEKTRLKNIGRKSHNEGKKCPEHSKFMKEKMQGNQYLKGVKYPYCSCTECHHEVTTHSLGRHIRRYHDASYSH